MMHPQGLGSRPGIAAERLCAAAGVSRASYYRSWAASAPRTEETALRDLVQKLAIAHKHNGYRRITELVRRAGWPVNRKRIARLMREDNLLCLRRRKFVVTTDSAHDLPVYPNLARAMTLSGLDQLWVADITYIRLLVEFVYMAVWAPRSSSKPA